MSRPFETGWAGIADHIWIEMLKRYPQLWVLREFPLHKVGKEPAAWSKTRAIWTIHLPEPLEDTDRLRRSAIPGERSPELWYYCLASANGYDWAEVMPYESIEETVASHSRQVPIFSLAWVILIRVQPMENPSMVDVWQRQVQPDQLVRWQTAARQEATGLFAPDSTT